MTREMVDELLKGYRGNIARRGHLDTEISQLQENLNDCMKTLHEDVSTHAQVIDDMPHGSGVGNPTERIGLMLAEGWVPDYIKDIQRELDEKLTEYAKLNAKCMFVEAWLSGLSKRERWVVEAQIIDGECWRNIINEYRNTFYEDSSKDSLKRTKIKAMEKIYSFAE